LKDSFEKRLYCFRSNKQRIIDDRLHGGIWGTVYPDGHKVWDLAPHYDNQNRRLFIALQQSGCEYEIVPMNECDYIISQGEVVTQDQMVIDFHRWYRDSFFRHGCDYRLLTASLNGPRSTAIGSIKVLGYAIEIHGCNSPTRMMEYYKSWGSDRVYPDGDGEDPRADGRPGDKPNKREPSVDQGLSMGSLMRDLGIMRYRYFNRNIEAGGVSDIDRAQYDVVKALVDGYWNA